MKGRKERKGRKVSIEPCLRARRSAYVHVCVDQISLTPQLIELNTPGHTPRNTTQHQSTSLAS